jgi:hypothetical protein
MTDKAKAKNPKALPRPQYLPEVGLPPRKPVRPSNVLPLPPGIYLTETGKRRNADKKK